MPVRNNDAGSGEHRPRRFRLPSRETAPRTRSVLLATGLLVVVVAPLGVAATGNPLREGVRNGTTTKETEIVSNIKSSTGLKGGYSTRQSNLSSSGGGAVYGCRSQAGGSAAKPTPQNPCIRANNLSRGLAFELNSTLGDIAGLITAGNGGDTKKPFVTNATGVATGLNADRVDNLDAAQIIAATRAPFAQVTSAGAPGETLGVVANGVTDLAGAGAYSVTFTGDLSKCALAATVVSATAAAQASVSPAVVNGNTVVTVHTAIANGTAQDLPFHLSARC